MILTPNARIEALEPYGLAVVPGFDPARPHDGGWRDDWKAWADRVVRLRNEILADAEGSSEMRRLQRDICRQSPTYWAAMYGWIEEPRPMEGEDTIKPFCPFSCQVQQIDWFVEKNESPRRFDGMTSKPRGVGATFTFCEAAVWGWLYRDWRGKFISAVEEKVDKPLDADTIFGKFDIILNHLPWWMLPKGFDPDLHRLHRMLKNPETGAQINGHATSPDASRGTRATYAVVDEAAFIRDNLFTPVWNTLSGATNHRWGISSESFEKGRQWWDTWHAAKALGRPEIADVLELEWQDNPYYDDLWYEEERLRCAANGDEAWFVREYLRDPRAGSEGAVYDEVNDVSFVDGGYDPDLDLHVGIDPGMKDETALVFLQVRFDDGRRRVRVVDAYQNSMRTAEFYAHILTGIPAEPGDPAWGERFGPRDEQMMGWLRDVPWTRLKPYMDPAGSQTNMSGLSFLDRLVKESRRLRERQRLSVPEDRRPARSRAVVPSYKEINKFQRNRLDVRHLAAREVLTSAEVTDNPGGRMWHGAMRDYTWAPSTARATGDTKPLHDGNSHLVTAFEFASVYLCLLGLVSTRPKGRDKPKRSVWGSHAADAHVAA